jgi:hypothetical protein
MYRQLDRGRGFAPSELINIRMCFGWVCEREKGRERERERGVRE